MKLFDLLHKKEYKKLSVKEIETIIDNDLSYKEYSVIAGNDSFEKALTCFDIISRNRD